MEGRVALVTGGGRGIGRAIAVRLARGGAKVAVSYRANDEAAEETARLVREAGAECETFKGDVASSEDVDALFAGVKEAFGPVEILVNNAGTTRDNIMLRMKDAEFDEVLQTNLKGTYLCTRAVLRGMVRARWGRIVNVSSVVGLLGNAGQANYAASKAGIIGMTKSVAREVANRGITANAVAPGYVETELTGALSEEIKERILGQVPVGRFGEPEEIAEVVAFLVGDGAAYITGQTITVDGGMVMQ
ncbi:3-oxoacyl-[acyl-carrier-protein] reductase [Rubrobacter marinus]|uniref:3-oxoacyl-[acyl-carrier-protein] reductase n=1 Tax=Rubrobacter marinus TaxID=2653852 RepID=A0A6G8PXK6_9ACTN|nr:3-oxoacyl-[acyl-carrier-protein] reductase [Rubrobacter marinus]QIN78949.1 3-oxoacyl-[acyl-carrier-protein] reductase [Rubrobacter marinus]